MKDYSNFYERPLEGGLVMRSLRDSADAARVAAFNGVIHGPSTEPLAYAIMTEHPHSEPQHWLYIEDSATERIVSSLCLIPWQLQFGEARLRSGEMGFVGTLEEYRGRGLIRQLNERHSELMRAGGFDMSHIQGIPYFYRQFGYEYAIPLEAWCRVELHQYGPPAADAAYSLRPAVIEDLPVLMRFHAEAARALQISAQRDEATWRYLFGPSLQTDTGGRTWIVERAGHTPAGYIRVMPIGFGEGLICGEASLLHPDASAAALSHLVALAREQNRPYVRLNLPRQHSMVAMALARGAHPYSCYGWQIRILDPQAILRKLAPVFEQRIAASAYAGLSRTLTLNLYHMAFALQFVEGRLAGVEQRRDGQWGDLRLPPQLLPQLVFGWRSFDELNYAFPDASANDDARMLVDVLFPPAAGFLYNLY